MLIETATPILPSQAPQGDRRISASAFLVEPKQFGAWANRHRWIAVAAIVIAAIAVLGVAWRLNASSPVEYATAPVTRGDVITTITASGTVNPVVTVEVGTYVSGTIQTLSCDYNTKVHKGQLCAKIDPKPYQVVVDEDQADLNTAKAQLAKDQANLVYTKLTQERDDTLLKENAISHDADDAARDANNQALSLVNLMLPRSPIKQLY